MFKKILKMYIIILGLKWYVFVGILIFIKYKSIWSKIIMN